MRQTEAAIRKSIAAIEEIIDDLDRQRMDAEAADAVRDGDAGDIADEIGAYETVLAFARWVVCDQPEPPVFGYELPIEIVGDSPTDDDHQQPGAN